MEDVDFVKAFTLFFVGFYKDNYVSSTYEVTDDNHELWGFRFVIEGD